MKMSTSQKNVSGVKTKKPRLRKNSKSSGFIATATRPYATYFTLTLKKAPAKTWAPTAYSPLFWQKKIHVPFVRSPKPKKIFSFSLAAGALLALVVLLGGAGILVLPGAKPNPLAIKDFTVKQASAAVAGMPVNYTIVVKRASITSNQYLVPVPKEASHVSVKNISLEQARHILFNKQLPQPQLGSSLRRQLADAIQLPAPKNNGIATLYEFASRSILRKATVSFIDLSAKAAEPSVFKKLSDSVVAQASTEDLGQTSSIQDPQPSDMTAQTINSEQNTPPAVVEVEASGNPISSNGQVQSETDSDSAPGSGLAPAESQSPGDSTTNIQTPSASSGQGPSDPAVLESSGNSDYLQIDYQLPSPVIAEQSTANGKIITISAPEGVAGQPLADVLAYAKLPELFKVDDQRHITITWQNNQNQPIQFAAMDLDQNGYLDYAEWIVPGLLEAESFEITFSKTDATILPLLESPIFDQQGQSSVLVKPAFGDGSTNIAFYIPYGDAQDWVWQSETPAIGSLPFVDYWGPTPAAGKYVAVEYHNDAQQFSCSDLSLEACINDPHFISQTNFEITE